MAVLPKIQEFLDFMATTNQEQGQNSAPNYLDFREMTDTLFATYVTENIDHSMLAVDATVLNGSYPVPVRCYIPDQNQALPVAIFLHGGGHMTGSVNAYDGITRKLAKSSGYIIVSVDYRLSPEVAYPTALEDCQAVLENIFDTLDQHQIKYSSRELTLIGDSGGGTLCN
jgi:acetyl esterase